MVLVVLSPNRNLYEDRKKTECVLARYVFLDVACLVWSFFFRRLMAEGVISTDVRILIPSHATN
jgi:hypothetical protein